MRASRLSTRLAGLMLATCLTPAAFAAPGAPLPVGSPIDQAPLAISARADLTVRPDRTVQKILTLRIKVQSEASIQNVGQQRLTYVENMESLNVVEAYTEKADGSRVEVDLATLIKSDASSGLAHMFLRDQKTLTTIFPDLAVGDSIVLKAAYDKTKDFFPDQFADQFVFPRIAPFRDATITVTAPKDFPLNTFANGDIVQTSEDGEFGTRRVFTYRSRGLVTEQPGSVSVWDRDAYVLVSSFKDFAELGRAYWSEATPKAEVTPQIQKIADQVTNGITDRRAQAEALDRFVKRNIRYVAVYIGAGRWTPHAADDVLKNRYGDCKDHAILLTALLAAKGIEAEQVLINQGNAYTLPEIPAKSHLNHAIVYLPEFDLYDDPTASYTAFGVLHEQSYDKPVVHGGLKGGRVARTPVMRATDHVSVNQTTINVAADGTLSGETVQTATGVFASGLRSAAVRAQADGPDAAGANLMKLWSLSGKARIEAPAFTALSESYQTKVSFELERKWAVPLAGQRDIPIGVPMQKRPTDFLLNVRQNTRRDAFQCYSGRQVEEIRMVFAPGLPLPQTINGRTIENRVFSYASSYRLDGRTLTVRREFTAHVPGQVCAPEVEAEIGEAIKTARASMGTRLTFKEGTPVPVSQNLQADGRRAELPAPGGVRF